MVNGGEVDFVSQEEKYQYLVFLLVFVDIIKFFVFLVFKLFLGGGEFLEEVGTFLFGQELVEEEDIEEEEENGILKDFQKVLEKGQGVQQLEGNDFIRFGLFVGEEWIVESLVLKFQGLVFLSFGLYFLVFNILF